MTGSSEITSTQKMVLGTRTPETLGPKQPLIFKQFPRFKMSHNGFSNVISLPQNSLAIGSLDLQNY